MFTPPWNKLEKTARHGFQSFYHFTTCKHYVFDHFLQCTKSNQKICREEKPFRKIVALQCNLFRKPSFRAHCFKPTFLVQKFNFKGLFLELDFCMKIRVLEKRGKKKVWKPMHNITGKNVVISSDYFHFFWGPLGEDKTPRLLPNKHLINASSRVESIHGKCIHKF